MAFSMQHDCPQHVYRRGKFLFCYLYIFFFFSILHLRQQLLRILQSINKRKLFLVSVAFLRLKSVVAVVLTMTKAKRYGNMVFSAYKNVDYNQNVSIKTHNGNKNQFSITIAVLSFLSAYFKRSVLRLFLYMIVHLLFGI